MNKLGKITPFSKKGKYWQNLRADSNQSERRLPPSERHAHHFIAAINVMWWSQSTWQEVSFSCSCKIFRKSLKSSSFNCIFKVSPITWQSLLVSISFHVTAGDFHHSCDSYCAFECLSLKGKISRSGFSLFCLPSSLRSAWGIHKIQSVKVGIQQLILSY